MSRGANMSGRAARAWQTVLAALAIVLPPASSARAQLSSVTVQRDLSFGTIMTGTLTSVSPTAAGAALWKIHGLITLGGGMSFTLPPTLSRVGGGGTLAITFCSTCALYRVGSQNPNGATTFNPQSGTGLVVGLSDIYVWLGASVNPPLNQRAGTYTGTVVFTVAGLL